MAVKDYVSVTRLSEDRDPSALEREGKGYMAWKNGALAALFHNGAPMTFMAYLEFKNGVTRGNHYHVRQHQNMVVLSGELRAKFVLPDAPDDVLELTLTPGDVLSCAPGCVHSYMARDTAVAVEYAPTPYEVDDLVAYPVEW
ncbi:cupin domain-containing protein [Streptomyces sp. ODS28]|uniref:cupin domain-containing protein n=1 Tax=Streptomyces sp. ODS28 TaxID=3136688 RepID=UPI0031EE0976